jgi:hypothetical protein
MKAQSLIDSASFGPDTLKILCRVFDDAWTSVAGNFGDDPSVIERARIRLAQALLSVASEEARDPVALKRAALEVMAGVYQDREARFPH